MEYTVFSMLCYHDIKDLLSWLLKIHIDVKVMSSVPHSALCTIVGNSIVTMVTHLEYHWYWNMKNSVCHAALKL